MAKDSSAKKLRVLHVTKWYPNKNDVQNGVFIQKHILASARHCEVKVLAWLPAEDGVTTTQESHENGLAITRTWFKPKTPVSAKRHAFADYIHSHYNNKNLPDILHLHVFSPDLLIAVYWAKRKKIPVVISEHWSGYARGLFDQLPKWRKWSYKRLAKVNRVLPVSAFLRDSMLECGIEANYSIVPNVVDHHSFHTEKRPGFSFVVVADLVDAVKNISGIINAFEKVATKNKTTELHIIGGGPDEEMLRELATKCAVSKQIHMHGRLANAEVQKMLPAFHCLIINSRVETFGVVMLEAHAAGLPVITTQCGGPEEWLEEADLLIRKDSSPDLASSMQTMIERGPQNITYSKWKECLPEKVGEKLFSVYQEVLSAHQQILAKNARRSSRKS